MTLCRKTCELVLPSKRANGSRTSKSAFRHGRLTKNYDGRIIWELIKGEMIYVKDLETIETVNGPFHFCTIVLTSFDSSSSGHCVTQISFRGSVFLHSCMTSSTTLLRFMYTTAVCWIAYTRSNERNTRLSARSFHLYSTPRSTGSKRTWNISPIIPSPHSESTMRWQIINHSKLSSMYVLLNPCDAH